MNIIGLCLHSDRPHHPTLTGTSCIHPAGRLNADALQCGCHFVTHRGHQWPAHLGWLQVWHPPAHVASHATLCLLSYCLPPWCVTCLLLLLASFLPFPHLTTIATPFHFAGVPRSEILQVSELLATKLIANEFAAYFDLQQLMASLNALSECGFTIMTYALCSLANLSLLAIMIRVLSVMVPLPHHVIACVLCLACRTDQMGSPSDGKLCVGGLVKSVYRCTVDHQCCVAYLINNIMFFILLLLLVLLCVMSDGL